MSQKMNMMIVSLFVLMNYDDSKLPSNVNMILGTYKESEDKGCDSGLKILI